MIKDLTLDEAILTKKCRRATQEDSALVADLTDTLNSIEDAACLAANQIGEPVALCVYKDEEGEVHALFNPRVMMGLGAQRVEEGCLTREDTSKVTRYAKIKLAYEELGEDGELHAKKRDYLGWTAQMIQHMCDHMAGKYV